MKSTKSEIIPNNFDCFHLIYVFSWTVYKSDHISGFQCTLVLEPGVVHNLNSKENSRTKMKCFCLLYFYLNFKLTVTYKRRNKNNQKMLNNFNTRQTRSKYLTSSSS